MKVKFQLPELLILSATLLLCHGLSTAGWSFFGCGLFLAFARFSLEHQHQVKLEGDIEKSIDTFKEAVPGFIKALRNYINNSSDKIH